MSSSNGEVLKNLERDLPTTSRDVAALRRLRAHQPADPFAAIQALVDELPRAARVPRRTTSEGWEPFEL